MEDEHTYVSGSVALFLDSLGVSGVASDLKRPVD